MNTHEQKAEERIFQAAMQVFEEKGPDGARMQEIADRAGINKAMLHYYYRSKEKLFDAVFNKLAAVMFGKLFACFENDLPFKEQLDLFYKEHISFLQAHPRLPAFILNEINNNPQRIVKIFEEGRFKALRERFFKEINQDIEAGLIRPTDKMQLLINIVGLSVFPFMARGLIKEILKEENVNFDDFIDQRKIELSEFIINAVSVK